MDSTTTLTRTQRTAAQAVPSATVLLVVKYFLAQFGIEIPDDVLIALLVGVFIVASKLHSFAEMRGWLTDRRATN